MRSLGASIAVFDLQLPKGASGNAVDLQGQKYFKVDVSKTEDVAAAVEGVVAWSKETKKPIAVVVCCAGFLGPAKARLLLTTIALSILMIATDSLKERHPSLAGDVQKGRRHQPHRHNRRHPPTRASHVNAACRQRRLPRRHHHRIFICRL